MEPKLLDILLLDCLSTEQGMDNCKTHAYWMYFGFMILSVYLVLSVSEDASDTPCHRCKSEMGRLINYSFSRKTVSKTYFWKLTLQCE